VLAAFLVSTVIFFRNATAMTLGLLQAALMVVAILTRPRRPKEEEAAEE
jgi:hypothetical protein